MTKNKKKYFGTDGIRGRANGSKMNPNVALKLGMAAGTYFTRGEYKHHVLIGKDTRLSGYTIEPALVSGFLSMGMNVYLAGPLPTPGISALVTSMRCDIGVMISASHNSYVDNGIKIFGPNGNKLNDEAEMAIEKLMDADLNKMRVDSIKLGRAQRIEDAGGRYIEYLKSKFSSNLRLDGIKIILDCANGAAYKVAPKILWELGAEVIPINVDPDGTNVNKNCGSTHPENMLKKVLDYKADIGIALDGDADRCIIASEKGKLINGDQIIAMIANRWKESGKLKKNTVVGTVLSNQGLINYLSKKGINFIRTKVGDRYILEKMKELNSNLGAEPSGHIILGDYAATGDGLLASIEILGLLKNNNLPLSLISNVFEPLPQVTCDIEIKNINSNILLNHASEELQTLENDLKKKGRIVIRMSGTENKLRIMTESHDKLLAQDIIRKASSIITKYNKN